MAFSKYGAFIQEHKQAQQADFVNQYTGMMARTAMDAGSFGWDGKNASYVSGSNLGSLEEAWNHYKTNAESRGVKPNYIAFAQQFNQMKSIQDNRLLTEMTKLTNRGVSSKKIKKLAKENPEFKERLIRLSGDNPELAESLKQFLPYEGPSTLEMIGDAPSIVKAGAGLGAVGGISYLAGYADPDAVAEATKIWEEANDALNKGINNDGTYNKSWKKKPKGGGPTKLQEHQAALKKAAKKLEDVTGTRAGRLLSKVKGFRPGAIGAGASLAGYLVAPTVGGFAEETLTGEDTGKWGQRTQGVVAGGIAAQQVGQLLRCNQTAQAALKKALGPELWKAGADVAAKKKISKTAQNKLAKGLAAWTAKTFARQAGAAAGGWWTGGAMNAAFAALSIYDLVSLLTGASE